MPADATRARVLWAVLDTELPVNAVARAVGRSPAAVSQHLAKLRTVRLVRTREQGTQDLHRIKSSQIRQLVLDVVLRVDPIANAGVTARHRGDPPMVGQRAHTTADLTAAAPTSAIATGAR